ncbi:hypothetical protein EK21DRAFT_119291 [Setomelanomma holmii]|uniref:Uncharacterized protein n=1 Tax=Setomelanomma holmii TaxID=210430 RepID=A0A9P4GUC7_9PLEO|nr:hypothetical protein EK21DRAFT_119291 [Setomelanomma holmii]
MPQIGGDGRPPVRDAREVCPGDDLQDQHIRGSTRDESACITGSPSASRCTSPKCLSSKDAVEARHSAAPAARPQNVKPPIPASSRDSSTTHSPAAPSLTSSGHGGDALPPVAQDACLAVSAATPPFPVPLTITILNNIPYQI